MGEAMVIDVPEMKGCGSGKKSMKRKRVEFSMTPEERETRIGELRRELDSLVKYYHEGEKEVALSCDLGGNNMNSMIACLLEKSSLPLSKLVGEIYDKLKGKDGNGAGLITPASVKSSVLLIGQRTSYGVPDSNADVLEDVNPSCLWCWETRDLKLLPKSMRAGLKIRRTCHRKINERITAVSAVITELEKSDSNQKCRQDLTKVLERLGKVLNEAEIRSLVENMLQKTGAEMAEKTVKREAKHMVKQLEKDKREAEKEKKKMERELQKEKLQNEKELKRLQEEAEKEDRRREKEESEMKRHRKRLLEEEEKEQRRREKEEAESKKKLALQKQASLLERFLKKSKNNPPSQDDQPSTKAMPADAAPDRSEKMPESIAQSMDNALSYQENIDVEGIWKSHLITWHQLGHSNYRKQHWGARRKPKTEVIKELKLTASSGLPCDSDLNLEKPEDGWSETKANGRSCNTNADGSCPSSQKCSQRKQLLQFDKSHRPAFYGIWPKKSQIVRPRRPLIKDPLLDYEIDSDEEWEEEEPGESLSDCDKEEEESMEEGFSKADDEDESEDGFFVPDGYLSENEGVQVERMHSTDFVEEARSSPDCKHEVEAEAEEFHSLLRHQKHLQNLTEHALRKNRPLVILNLMHEKARSLLDEGPTETLDREQMCLQALSIRAFPVGPSIEICVGIDEQEVQEHSPLGSKGSTTPVASGTAILDNDLPEIVSIIQSSQQNINKLVESLHQKFLAVSKSQLRNKVREISNFSSTENRWQVKKDILNKLGLSTTPDKSSRGSSNMSITTFFSKRCLPPAAGNTHETSPQSVQKSLSAAVEVQQNNAHNNTHQ